MTTNKNYLSLALISSARSFSINFIILGIATIVASLLSLFSTKIFGSVNSGYVWDSLMSIAIVLNFALSSTILSVKVKNKIAKQSRYVLCMMQLSLAVLLLGFSLDRNLVGYLPKIFPIFTVMIGSISVSLISYNLDLKIAQYIGVVVLIVSSCLCKYSLGDNLLIAVIINCIALFLSLIIAPISFLCSAKVAQRHYENELAQKVA